MIDWRMAVTVRFADPLTAPEEAWIDVLPEMSPVDRPVAVTLATLGFVDFHVTKLVMLEVTPPLKSPVAVNCCCVPVLIDAAAGATEMADKPDNVPVPLREASNGLFEALVTTVSVPVRVPSAVGVKVTVIVHPLSFGSVCGANGQLFICPKSPVTLMDETLRGTPCRFLSAMLCAALVVLTIWLE